MPNDSEERCRSMRMDGSKCKARVVPGAKLCHFHDVCGPVLDDDELMQQSGMQPVLTDPASIQTAITRVCENLIQGRLDSKQAGILLYACQVAASNVARLPREAAIVPPPDKIANDDPHFSSTASGASSTTPA